MTAVTAAAFALLVTALIAYNLGKISGREEEQERLQREYDRTDELYRELSWRLYDVRIREKAVEKATKEKAVRK